MAKVIKPMASDYIDLKNYIADMQSYYKAMGKSPYKVAPHVYKEMGIYSIQDLIEHRENNPWSRVDL
jgi:hypothetical protein